MVEAAPGHEAAPDAAASLSAEAPLDAHAAPATEATADTEVAQAATSTESIDMDGSAVIPKKPKPVRVPYPLPVFPVTNWCSSVWTWAQRTASPPYRIKTMNHEFSWMTTTAESSPRT